MSFPKLHVSPVPGDVQHVTGPLRVLDVSLLQREPLVLWPLSVLSRHGSLPSQLFIYVNGTLVNPSTGLLLTGASNRVQLEKPREGVKPQVVHLMNEQWYFIGGRVVSAWNGLVLTRKQGDNRLYILPPDQTDK